MQKNSKNYKTSSMLHFKTKQVRTGRKIEKKKNFLRIRSNPTQVRNFKNKCKKILKIKKDHPGFITRRTGMHRPKKIEEKKFPSYPFEPDPSYKIEK